MRQRPCSPTANTSASVASRANVLAAVPCAVLLLCAPTWVFAQAVLQPPKTGASSPTDPLRLRTSPLLQENVPDEVKGTQPTFVMGDRITGRPDLETVIDGNAELRRTGSVIRADRIEYEQTTDTVKGLGNVRINREGNTYTGTEAELKIDSVEGYVKEPTYQFLKNGAYGQASRLDFLDSNHAVARNATYTTCTRRPGPSWMPDWILKAAQVQFDTETQTAQAQDVELRFKDVPLLTLSSMSFPLSEERKSGWLPPTLDADNVNGFGVSVPYYWNIAPNRDATVHTSLMSKRGINIGSEFRYLESDYSGNARYDLMPGDRLRSATRWGFASSHSGTLYSGVPAIGNLSLNLGLNRVSDDNYSTDFPRASSTLTQRLLANDGTLAWAQGEFSLSARALKWQTLQIQDAIIVPPYDRLPQITARFNRFNWASLGGLDVSAEIDTTRFRSDPTLTLQPNGRRSYALAQVSKPWIAPGYYITPKVQWHATDYKFETPISTGATQAQRVVPTFSLDSGLVFERDASYFGRSFTQTLEPRAFYVRTPFRAQAALPNYDSGVSDFNFASIFSENPFVGNDRIADNNLLTLGLTSRLLDPATGAEALRLAYAQRLRFSDQNVTLPGGKPDTARFSDMLFGASVNWTPQWATDTVVQYNPQTRQSERATLGARYNPSNYRVISAAYRFTRGQSEQVDVGWQWPLNDLWGDKGQNLGPGAGQGEGRWYSVGRLNYSLQDRKLVDTVVGLEYDAGCWLGRVVFNQIQTTKSSASKGIAFQLEFVGFTRLGVGTNPLRTLKDNIPSYEYLREKTSTSPSRFSSYD
jgi:LPS-assembly protein